MIDYAEIAKRVAPQCRIGVPPSVVELIHFRMLAGQTGAGLGFGADGQVIEEALKDAETQQSERQRQASPETEEDA